MWVDMGLKWHFRTSAQPNQRAIQQNRAVVLPFEHFHQLDTTEYG